MIFLLYKITWILLRQKNIISNLQLHLNKFCQALKILINKRNNLYNLNKNCIKFFKKWRKCISSPQTIVIIINKERVVSKEFFHSYIWNFYLLKINQDFFWQNHQMLSHNLRPFLMNQMQSQLNGAFTGLIVS